MLYIECTKGFRNLIFFWWYDISREASLRDVDMKYGGCHNLRRGNPSRLYVRVLRGLLVLCRCRWTARIRFVVGRSIGWNRPSLCAGLDAQTTRAHTQKNKFVAVMQITS